VQENLRVLSNDKKKQNRKMTETETVLKAQKSKQLEVTPKLTIIEWSRVLNEV
jgi:hypothetical protein